jgi:digeranylgeranylglycerophospholipid reductase
MRPPIDVVIVGGGPAGLYAGLRLVRAGWRVELLEEHRDIGEPVHCTGVLAPEAFETFGLPADSLLNPLTTVRFFAPSGERVEYSPPSVEAVVIDRIAFDRQLAEQAVQAGVVVRRGRVTGVELDRDEVRVLTEADELRARACVLACGANYAIQRKLGLGLPRLMLQSAQIEVPAKRLGPVEIHFGAQVAPGGFAWAVPVQRPDRACVRVGVMCDADARGFFRRLALQLEARWGIEGAADYVPRQKILPLGPIKRTYADRLLVLGDAAGLVKPTTGGGIYFSLLSAKLASATLDAGLKSDSLDQQAMAAYERTWRRQLGSELRWQLVLRRIAERLSDADIERLFELAQTDGIMPIVRRTATFNHHREFIVALLKHPPARRVLLRAAFA